MLSAGVPVSLVTALIRSAAISLLLGATYAPGLVSAHSLCESCEVQVGIGDTYHFWGTTGGVVLPVTLDWSDNRYELGLFRLSTRQILYDTHYRNGRVMADPYWGMSLSRRWRLFDRGPVRGFFGFGIAAKTSSDQLSVTRLDFASQFGLRFPFPGTPVWRRATLPALDDCRNPPAESWSGLCDADFSPQSRISRGRQRRA